MFYSFNNRATVIRGFATKSNHSLAQIVNNTVSRQAMLIIRRGNETLDLDITHDDKVPKNDSLMLFFSEMTPEKQIKPLVFLNCLGQLMFVFK